MAFYVIDYKGVKVGQQGREVFKGRTYRSAVDWLARNQTEEDIANDRYCLDMDPDTYRRWEARQIKKAKIVAAS